MHAIAMDTHLTIAGGVLVVEGVVARQDPTLSSSTGEAALASGGFPPALVRQTTVKKASCVPTFSHLSWELRT